MGTTCTDCGRTYAACSPRCPHCAFERMTLADIRRAAERGEHGAQMYLAALALFTFQPGYDNLTVNELHERIKLLVPRLKLESFTNAPPSGPVLPLS